MPNPILTLQANEADGISDACQSRLSSGPAFLSRRDETHGRRRGSGLLVLYSETAHPETAGNRKFHCLIRLHINSINYAMRFQISGTSILQGEEILPVLEPVTLRPVMTARVFTFVVVIAIALGADWPSGRSLDSWRLGTCVGFKRPIVET